MAAYPDVHAALVGLLDSDTDEDPRGQLARVGD